MITVGHEPLHTELSAIRTALEHAHEIVNSESQGKCSWKFVISEGTKHSVYTITSCLCHWYAQVKKERVSVELKGEYNVHVLSSCTVTEME